MTALFSKATCRQVGLVGLIAGSFYAATITVLLIPSAGFFALSAGALWFYGQTYSD
jgi:hypothetical protein